MSFDDRLIHEVAIMRSTDGAVDEYNQPTQSFEAIDVVWARIRPKNARELAQVNETGPGSGNYLVYMRPHGVTEADHLVHQADGEVYEIGFVAPQSGRTLHHDKIDATRVWPNG